MNTRGVALYANRLSFFLLLGLFTTAGFVSSALAQIDPVVKRVPQAYAALPSVDSNNIAVTGRTNKVGSCPTDPIGVGNGISACRSGWVDFDVHINESLNAIVVWQRGLQRQNDLTFEMQGKIIDQLRQEVGRLSKRLEYFEMGGENAARQ